MGPGKGRQPSLDLAAMARDDALLDAIGARAHGTAGATGADHGPEAAGAGPGDPLAALLQAFVADLDRCLVAHPSLEDDDRALGLRVVASEVTSVDTPTEPAGVAARTSVAAAVPDGADTAALVSASRDESAVLSGPAARIHAAAKIFTAARGTRVVREVPPTAHRRHLDRRTAVTSAAAMAVAFTVSLGGVAAAVSGNAMTPYRQVLESVGITQPSADLSPEQGVAIARELGAAQAAVDRKEPNKARE